MGRLRKRYNWKSRLSQPEKADESVEQKEEKIEVCLDVRGNQYDESNPLLSSSSSCQKKKKDKKGQKFSETKKKPLSKKQKLRLIKVLEKKKKTEDRSVLLEKLAEVQATPDELLRMTSTSTMQTSGFSKKNVATSSTDASFVANNVKGGKKNLRQLPEKKLKLDPNVVGYEDTDDGDSSDESDNEKEPLSFDKLQSDIEISNETAQCDVTLNKHDMDTVEEEKIKGNTPDEKVVNLNDKKLHNENEIKKSYEPVVFVPVHRSPEIQTAREALPIYSEEQAIMEAIKENPVVVVHGATGTGKTTQIPQFLYEAGFTRNGMVIGITEPRRIAAVQMATRVAEEMNLPDAVSYHIRYEKTASDFKTEIKFMTDGVLLKEMRNDFLLTRYSVIIIDEAHERSIFSDVLIGLLSRILPLREKKKMPLKLVIMSATLRVEDFTENRRLFKEKPFLITLDSRQYDVVIHFNTKTPEDYIQGAFDKICKIHRQLPAGAILAFVTGEKEVKRLCKLLRKAFPFKEQSSHEVDVLDDKPPEVDETRKKTKKRKHSSSFSYLPKIDLDDYSIEPLDNEGLQHQDSDEEDNVDDNYAIEDQMSLNTEPLYILPLYSHLSTADQAKVFKPPPMGSRLCVVATNVAETSVTIPGLKYVVDTGKVKTRVYDKVSCGISNFAITWASKASANQRAGRAGRTEGGHCYRLYSSAVFEHDFPEFTPPDIQRIPVDDMLLQMKVLGIDRVVNFPFPTPPDIEALKAAEKRLVMLGALEDLKKNLKYRDIIKWEYSARVTPLGKAMSRFPLSPRYSKMLLLAHKHNVVPHAIAIVSAMTVPEVFYCSKSSNVEDAATKEDEKRGVKNISAGQGKALKLGDIMVLLRAVGSYGLSKNKTQFCAKYGLRLKAMTEVQKMRLQLVREMNRAFSDSNISLDLNVESPTEEQVEKLRKVVTSSFTDHIAKRIPEDLSKSSEQILKHAYKCLDLEEPIFIHPNSVLCKELPEYVVYQEIFQTSRYFMRTVCEMEPEWLTSFAPNQCTFSSPLETPSPYYDKKADKVMCSMTSTFGRWNWELPCVVMPMPSGLPKYNWFSFSLLDGQVCPLFKAYKKFLLSPPAVMLKQWARLLPRTRILLQALINKEVDCKESLYKIWKTEPKYLLQEYCEWLQEEKHMEVACKWPPMPKES